MRQRRLFTFLRRLIQLRTEAEPIVLLIDDLHWIDPGSDLFLAQIVEAVSATRTCYWSTSARSTRPTGRASRGCCNCRWRRSERKRLPS